MLQLKHVEVRKENRACHLIVCRLAALQLTVLSCGLRLMPLRGSTR